MARIAFIGGSDDDKLRDELVEKITRELIAKGHQIFHGGINSGVMKACAAGGGIGIIYNALAEQATFSSKSRVHTSMVCDFIHFRQIDFGPSIRRQLLTSECDLVICFDGEIGTFDELIGAIKAEKKIVLVGQYWASLLLIVLGKAKFNEALLRYVLPHRSIEYIAEIIEVHLRS